MRHLEGCYVDFDEYLTCLRKHRITPPGLSIKATLTPACMPACHSPPAAKGADSTRVLACLS
jgi:hypothetical protein